MSATGLQETDAPVAMEWSPAAQQQGRRAGTVVERKLDELCACLDNALSSSSPSRSLLLSPDADQGRVVEDIKKRIDFLRSLLVAEGECHVAGARPQYLVEAEARFAVLEAAFDQWARLVGAAPAAGEEEMEDSVSGTESECSCADSLQEAAAGDDADRVAVEAPVDAPPDVADKKHDSVVTREEAALPVAAVATKRDAERTAAAVATRQEAAPDVVDACKKRDAAEHQAAAETKRRTVQRRRWWRRSAAWCGAAGVVAVVAVGVAVELAAVAHHNVNVYVVPT